MQFKKILNYIKQFLYSFNDRMREYKRTAPLRKKLINIINQYGSISFHDFMESALYDQVAGFYMKRIVFSENINKQGDFMTSPKKFSPYYGQGIACLIEQLDTANKDRGGIKRVVSIAAGDGTLDKDLLDWLQKHNPMLYQSIHYESVEISNRQIKMQKEMLKNHKEKVTFIEQSGIEYLQMHRLEHTFIFSNEWLDTLPVHRIIKKNEKWQEIKIKKNWIGKLVKTVGEIQDEMALKNFFKYATKAGRAYENNKYNGYPINANTKMIEVAESLCHSLVSGFSLMVDYGTVKNEPTQSILTFTRNKKVKDFLSYPGSADITTYIDWDIWIHASGLTLQSVTCDLILLTYLTVLTQADIVESLQKQFKNPALLQSAGDYVLPHKLRKDLLEAMEKSEMWFNEGIYGGWRLSPFPASAMKTKILYMKRKLIAGGKR